MGASWLVAVGCDDNEDQVFPRAGAGEGGEAPGGGKSSVAGSQSNGGKAGASAGSAGEGGINLGGAGGDAGNGGTPGEAGQAGAGETAGVGGESPGGAGGASGAGGQGGSSGEGGTPSEVAASCSFTCANDAACVIGQDNTTKKCNPVSHRCEDPTNACTSDSDCLLSQSFWIVSCVDDTGCTPDSQACVNVNGQGYCAELTLDPDPEFACFGGAPRTFPRFGAAGNVDVCASPDPRCMAGVCQLGCGDPLNPCGRGNGNTCSAATGLCECAQPSECTKTGVCGGDGHCTECANDEDCAATVAFTGHGVCVAGKCGCADPTTCVNPGYATATAACH